MSGKQVTLDRFDDEYNGFERLRKKLRLPKTWEVTSEIIGGELPPLSPDAPGETVVENGVVRPKAESGVSVIRVGWRHGVPCKCPICGAKGKVHDHRTRSFRHLDSLGMTCIIEASIPRVRCDTCGTVRQVPFPIADPEVSYTKEFAKEAIRRMTESSMAAVARSMGCDQGMLARILRRALEAAVGEMDLSDTTILYVDEIQFGQGHDFITVFCDQTRRIIFMTEGNKAGVMDDFVEFLERCGGSRLRIQAVSMDMSVAFESGAIRLFENADLIWDRFHMVKSLNDALDSLRKRTARNDPRLRGVKYTVLMRAKDHDEVHSIRMERIRQYNPELAMAFDLKEEFCDILKITDPEVGIARLNQWFKRAEESGIKEISDKAKRFREKIDRIVSWFKFRISNGVAEGINSKLKKIKSQAYGYRIKDNFYVMSMLRLGKVAIKV